MHSSLSKSDISISNFVDEHYVSLEKSLQKISFLLFADHKEVQIGVSS